MPNAALGLALALDLALAQVPAPPPAGREAPPPPGPAPDLVLPPLRRLTLENGLRVTLVPVGSMPRATVTLSVRAGSGDEGPAEVGLASFVARLLLEGTRSRTAEEIAETAARWGGSVDASATPDETLVGGTVLSEFAPDLVRLVADVALDPAFPERALERVRGDVVRDVTIARTVPQTLAEERFLATLYPGHAYGRLLPTVEQVKGYTAAGVRAFHGRHMGAGRAHLYVAGRFDAAAAERAIREAFASWAAGTARDVTPPRATTSRAIHLVDRPGAVQSSLYVGLPVLDPTHPDYPKLLVANTLLGGYFSSRMVATLREKKGYTYSPYSLLSLRPGTGYWAQIADVTTAVTGPSLEVIFEEIDRLRAEPPSPDELTRVQRYLAGSFLLQTSTREGLIGRLRFVDLHGLPADWLERYVERVRAVTPGDVQAAARQWLDPARMAIVVVGDEKQIGAQVKPFAAAPRG